MAHRQSGGDKTANTGIRHAIDFDFDWKFHLVDVPQPGQKNYDDAQWRKH